MSDTTPATLSPEELEAIRQRHAKATPGKWYYVASMTPEEAGVPNGAAADVVREVVPADDDGPAETESIISEMRDRDFEFMAESRQDIPALDAHAAALTRELEAARELVELLVDTLREHSSREDDGWLRGMGRSEARYAGKRLVELGLAEAHPENVEGRRTNRYRILERAALSPPPSPPPGTESKAAHTCATPATVDDWAAECAFCVSKDDPAVARCIRCGAERPSVLEEARAGLECTLAGGCPCDGGFVCSGHRALSMVKSALAAPTPAAATPAPAGGKLRNATPEEIEQQRQGYAAATVAEQLDPTARHTIPARQDAAAEKGEREERA